ncbi:hypothetical protein M8818_003328 [Zalaria obscura]|uniref:Uncharacterized protein n=1 Tax=Zalaria obscura TaxID=2024903 RepID=A0ACC3SFB7_9PEZI
MASRQLADYSAWLPRVAWPYVYLPALSTSGAPATGLQARCDAVGGSNVPETAESSLIELLVTYLHIGVSLHFSAFVVGAVRSALLPTTPVS